MARKQKTTAEVQAAIFKREHRKSPLRGGVKLTLKKARELALQEFGTAKGLQREEDALPDYYIMRLGKEHDFEIVGTSSDIASGLKFDHRPGLLEFHNEAVDGDVDILLVCDLSRLGRDLDRTLQYWYLLRDLDVSVHTANSGEVDLSVAAMLRKIIEQ